MSLLLLSLVAPETGVFCLNLSSVIPTGSRRQQLRNILFDTSGADCWWWIVVSADCLSARYWSVETRHEYFCWRSPWNIACEATIQANAGLHYSIACSHFVAVKTVAARKSKFLSFFLTLKGNNPPSSFFSKTLLIIFTIQFLILFSETLIISQTKSWVLQNNIKYKSEFEWIVLNGMASANHIQAAASWLATAAQPTT